MKILTAEDVARAPQGLLEAAERGEPSLVTRAGHPVMLTVPLERVLDAGEVRLEVAARIHDHEQISLGVAARIAVIRLEPGELERELDGFGGG